MAEITEFTSYVKRTIQQLIGLTIVVAVCLLLAGEMQYLSGWLMGSALNIIYFLMMSSRGLRALKLPPERAVYFIRGGAVFRLVMIMLALIVILQFPSIHLGAAVAGIFSYRVIIIGDIIYTRFRPDRRKEV